MLTRYYNGNQYDVLRYSVWVWQGTFDLEGGFKRYPRGSKGKFGYPSGSKGSRKD